MTWNPTDDLITELLRAMREPSCVMLVVPRFSDLPVALTSLQPHVLPGERIRRTHGLESVEGPGRGRIVLSTEYSSRGRGMTLDAVYLAAGVELSDPRRAELAPAMLTTGGRFIDEISIAAAEAAR